MMSPRTWVTRAVAVTAAAGLWGLSAAAATETEDDVVLAGDEGNEEMGMKLAKAFGLPVLIFFCFVALALVCDDYLAPSLEALVRRFKIPHDVASATFLAFGSSAPEISINCVATIHGKVSLSLSAVLGSGIIAYTVIPAACVLVSKGQVLHLEAVPLVRDMVFYAAALSAFVAFTSEEAFALNQNLILLGLFVVYLGAMVVLGKFYHEADSGGDNNARTHASIVSQNMENAAALKAERDDFDDDEEKGGQQERKHLLTRFNTDSTIPHHTAYGDDDLVGLKEKNRYGAAPHNPFENEVEEMRGRKELAEAQGCCMRVLGIITIPLNQLFHVTIPPFCWSAPADDDGNDGDSATDSGDDENAIEKTWPLTMFLSLVYVAIFSELVLVLTTSFAEVVGLSHNVAGLTIVALGAQVPDLFASMSVAKQGEGPSSIANAVGSQIINILVGIGGPFLISNLRTGVPVQVGAGGAGGELIMTGVMMLFLVVVFSVLCFRHMFCKARPSRKPELTSLDAVILASLYVVMLVVLVGSQVIVK
ncbi:Sodium/potassium/calcium exchanger 5 [Hondaea fermentalgiana]|uniref:Sodium/potassium/calcium exchanger 5 n=1 Tax=Hondaea fermentalgiana TaxID=2315210 RepID=A0A2R5GKK9_9STRA|nr:Sodium/potassium/calcium exchanger 5 [Hondaea fermentalgiana]|eukprot:GBG31446.1 Sodium/potassium/calcium exchanger 5 [Hondaea fermentalgiana]